MHRRRKRHTHYRRSLAQMHVLRPLPLCTLTDRQKQAHTYSRYFTRTNACATTLTNLPTHGQTQTSTHTNYRYSLIHKYVLTTPYPSTHTRMDANRHTQSPDTHSHTHVLWPLQLHTCTDGHKQVHINTHSRHSLAHKHVLMIPATLHMNRRTQTGTHILQTLTQMRVTIPTISDMQG